ncbi:3-deoxy-D-manno-octulosonic acid kinase [Alcaligenaceae bacterium]|nr:3-deoxy-D-manno-octulosonic acid kinase [Alcaligenaceae bacterium]
MADSTAIQDLSFGAMSLRVDTCQIMDPGSYLFDPTVSRLHATPVTQGGRQAAWFIQGDFGDAVLRHYRRGGLMAKVNSHHYWWAGAAATRSYAEFELLHYMFTAGLPVPQPLAASYTRIGLFYTASILVRRIAGVQTLAHVLSQGHHQAVAGAVLAMHQAGVWHADLNIYNILVNELGQVWLIDFDKGKRVSMTTALRTANVARLRRSLIKVAGEQGELWWQLFNQSYADQLKRLSPP